MRYGIKYKLMYGYTSGNPYCENMYTYVIPMLQIDRMLPTYMYIYIKVYALI